MADLALSAEQEQIRASLVGLLRQASSLEAARASEPLGFDAELWKRVHELGLMDMVAPGVIDEPVLTAALVCEQVGEALTPVPLVEAFTAVRLLDALQTEQALRLADLMRSEGLVGTVSPTPAIGKVARLAPAGAVAGVVAALDGQSLCVLEQEPPHIAIENLGAQPLADRSLQGSIIVAEGDEARSLYSHALDEWRVLSAARLVGAGWRSLQIAIEYAKSRNAFGVPIASYQAVNHRMADLATGLTGARLLVWRAAWELDHSGERTSALASMAYSFSAEQAEAAASDALHFHGGYGFMMEYDAQLYLRRVKTWATQLGDLSRELRRVADGLWPLAQVGV